jgi:hypothetical protein
LRRIADSVARLLTANRGDPHGDLYEQANAVSEKHPR